MNIPSDLMYTSDHEWVRLDGDIATIGITSYAADALGDVVYLELPAVGDTVVAGQPCGEIESTKSVSDLLAPVNGGVTAINDAVVADPALLNSDPFIAGWLIQVRVRGDFALLDAEQYTALTAGESA